MGRALLEDPATVDTLTHGVMRALETYSLLQSLHPGQAGQDLAEQSL